MVEGCILQLPPCCGWYGGEGKEGTGSHLVAIPPAVAGGVADGKEGAGSYRII